MDPYNDYVNWLRALATGEPVPGEYTPKTLYDMMVPPQ